MRIENADHFLITTTIALLAEVTIFVAYWQGLITSIGLVTAHLGLVWVLATSSYAPSNDKVQTYRQRAQLILTTLLGPFGPFLILMWLGLVWLQSTVAVRLFGTEPIFETLSASNSAIDSYRQAQKFRAEQLRTADNLLFGSRREQAAALRTLPEHHIALYDAQIQSHLQSCDTSLSTLAALAQKRVEEQLNRKDDDGYDDGNDLINRKVQGPTKEQRLEHARHLLKLHANRLRVGADTPLAEVEGDPETDLASLLAYLFHLGEFEAVRYFLGQYVPQLQNDEGSDLTKYQNFWRN